MAHLQCRRESSVFAFPSVFPMISRQILRRVEVVGFSIGEAKVGETHKKSDLLIFGIEKRDSPLVGKYVVKPLIKKPTRVEVGSFSCNNPTIFKVKLWRKWPFFRFFRNFRKMVVFPLGKQPTSCRLSLIPCNRQTVGYSKPRVFIPIF